MDLVGRRLRLTALLPELGADAFLVTSLPNVWYLTGFTGSNGQLVLAESGGIFLTDGRYVEQSRHEVPGLQRDFYTGEFEPSFARAAAELGAKRVAFEAAHLSYRAHGRLSETEGVELLPTDGQVEQLRWFKEPEERERLARAQGIADDAFDAVIGKLAEGMTEKEVAFELDSAMRRGGGDGLAFDTIVAFGENAAEPHHSPTDRALARGDVAKMDFGCTVLGYHSDMTRTVAFGEPPARLREIYEIVHAAQQAGIDAVRAGVSGDDADRAAREVIREAGYADAYKHSLGHGVGLEIHEGPTLRMGGTDVLPDGTVVTVEPGIYVEGLGGVRIEDMVEVTADGCRVIPRTTKELIVL